MLISRLMLLLTFLYHCHSRVLPPASRQPPLSLYLKVCSVLSTTLWQSMPLRWSAWEAGSPVHQKATSSQSGPPQFAFRTNRYTEDAMSTTLHSVSTHLENNNFYITMLFIDSSSAVSIVYPMKLKLANWSTILYKWTFDLLTNRLKTIPLWC